MLVGTARGYARLPSSADPLVKGPHPAWKPFWLMPALLGMIAYAIDTLNILAVPFLLIFVGGYYWAAFAKLSADYQARMAFQRQRKLALEEAQN